MTSLKTSIKTITYLSDTGCLEIQGASLTIKNIRKVLDVGFDAVQFHPDAEIDDGLENWKL
jgi:hypothetical protein